jgi:hypothetical protein
VPTSDPAQIPGVVIETILRFPEPDLDLGAGAGRRGEDLDIGRGCIARDSCRLRLVGVDGSSPNRPESSPDRPTPPRFAATVRELLIPKEVQVCLVQVRTAARINMMIRGRVAGPRAARPNPIRACPTRVLTVAQVKLSI